MMSAERINQTNPRRPPLASLAPGMTVSEARRILADAFRAAGPDSPALDARVLCGHALGLDHTSLFAAADHRLTTSESAALNALAVRRLAHEPVSRIIGAKEFWSLRFCVSPAVLVPRPQTETVVEAALAAIDARVTRTGALRLLDIGTGSGALLLALLSELPHAFGVGTDISTAALALARENASRLGLAARCAFLACNEATALHGPFDLVVSNPPYVTSGEIAKLAPEVLKYEPQLALDGGIDGLNAYRAIAADARRLLAPGGHLIVELGAGQEAAVAALFAAAGLNMPQPARKDLAGIARALSAHPAP